MSTNSSVTVKTENGYISIYGHWDGYPSGVGEVLKNHYDTQKKAEALVALGAFSILDESIEQPEGHSFDSRTEGHSVFYGRDRGEPWKDVKPETSLTMKEALDKYGQSYNYLWEDGKWLVSEYDDGFVELTDEMIAEN